MVAKLQVLFGILITTRPLLMLRAFVSHCIFMTSLITLLIITYHLDFSHITPVHESPHLIKQANKLSSLWHINFLLDVTPNHLIFRTWSLSACYSTWSRVFTVCWSPTSFLWTLITVPFGMWLRRMILECDSRCIKLRPYDQIPESSCEHHHCSATHSWHLAHARSPVLDHRF